ncbi:TPA: hypothetical protein MHW37_02975 [Klebsiella pneumoniae]|nr:hypothetical protein [Klebsiella pneumoniae]
MSGKVCVFGSFNFDMVARVDRFPVPGESLVACGSMTSAGGKGANQATAALKAGANVHYIGKIGNDTFGHFARRHLTTGAGDAFNGALAARLACGEPLQAAARFAAAYAAVSVEKQGASSLPEYLEAQERLLRAAADYEMA